MGLLNFFGSGKKPGITKEVGASGVASYGGYIESNEKNPKLRDAEKYRTYTDLLHNTTIVSAGVRFYLHLIGKSKWSLIPADDSAQAQEYADIITAQMSSIKTSWRRVIKRAAMYRFYGFSIQEWVGVKRDGMILFDDIKQRPQATITRWDIDDHGSVDGVIQNNPQNGEEHYLPRFRIIYMVDDTLTSSPDGLGLFRHIVKAVDRLSRYEQLEGYGFESDLRGVPVGRAPLALMAEKVRSGEMSETEMNEALSPMKTFIQKHIRNPSLGYYMDSMPYVSTSESGAISSTNQWDIDLLKGSSSSLPDLSHAIERINREIARTLGVEGLLLGETGTQALSRDKSSNLATVIDSALEEIAEVFNKDLTERLFELNGWDKALMPKFKTEAIRHRDITQVTSALKDLSDCGVIINSEDELVSEILDLLGLSPLNPNANTNLDLDDDDDDEIEQMLNNVKAKPDDKQV